MEAEKPHDLLSESWRPRTASSVIQFKSARVSVRGADDAGPNLRAAEYERCPHPNSETGNKKG